MLTTMRIGSVPHSGSMACNEFNGKMTRTRDNLDEPECAGRVLISHNAFVFHVVASGKSMNVNSSLLLLGFHVDFAIV